MSYCVEKIRNILGYFCQSFHVINFFFNFQQLFSENIFHKNPITTYLFNHPHIVRWCKCFIHILLSLCCFFIIIISFWLFFFPLFCCVSIRIYIRIPVNAMGMILFCYYIVWSFNCSYIPCGYFIILIKGLSCAGRLGLINWLTDWTSDVRYIYNIIVCTKIIYDYDVTCGI